jgi:carboxymethylenebutenolidase
MTDVEISTPHGAMPAYLSRPAEEPPWPGVVVLHDAFGMTTDVRRQADWLASEGYQAVVPDLMHWGGRNRCLWSLFGALRRRKGRVFDEIQATREWLAEQPEASGRIGVLGFCLGGGFALLVVPGGQFDAASVNYGVASGRPDPYGPEFLAGACPVVGSYGADDPSLRGAAARLAASLETVGVEHDVAEYPGARHSFINDHEPAEIPGTMRVAMRLMGSGYRPDAAADARRRIAAFFAEHLGRAE